MRDLMISKLKFVESVHASGTLAAYRETIQQTYAIAMGNIELAAAIRATKLLLEMQKAVKLGELQAAIELGEIKAKNEAERAAKLTVMLAADPEYVAARDGLEVMTRQAEVYEADLGNLRDTASGLKLELRLIAATLEFLSEGR